jgi:hypothetical protein
LILKFFSFDCCAAAVPLLPGAWRLHCCRVQTILQAQVTMFGEGNQPPPVCSADAIGAAFLSGSPY